MNDLVELENELKTLRPQRPSSGLMVRIEMALADAGKVPDRVITPHRFRVNWLAVAAGLVAAATLLALIRIEFHELPKRALTSATPSVPANQAESPNYQAAGLTQVVYDQRDEGLVFPANGEEPWRRVRTSKRETWQWQDEHTGAKLRVSYPAEEIALIPILGQ